MDALNARPGLLRQVNLSMIRRALKRRGTATRAEIARDTQISSTTVRTLLFEMQQSGEIESAGFDASSGGRKAERYRIAPGRLCGAAFCLSGGRAWALIVDARGEIVESAQLHIADGERRAIEAYLDAQLEQREIRVIGVGVPGIVEGEAYWRGEPDGGALRRVDIGGALRGRYGVPVFLENDLNATAVGFGQCYAREFPSETPDALNMAYLHFEKGCVSAGFIADGRVIRGCNRFAGEIGLIPVDAERSVDDWLAAGVDDRRYVRRVVQIAAWVCGVLNPQYIALGGPALRAECIAAVGDGLSALLPERMCAEILYAPDMWHDYRAGMACLTAERMFEAVQLVRA